MGVQSDTNGEPSVQPVVRLQNAFGANANEASKTVGGCWLSNAPRLREALRQANCDVGVLLKYLSQTADARLQSNFEDTRVRLFPVMPAVPPCRTYRHFLSRIFLISEALEDVQAAEPQLPNLASNDKPEGDENVDSISFVYWCRDFLSSLAAPATVNSIQVTQYYKQNRLNQHTVTGEPGGETTGFKEAADWIANNVRRLEWFGVSVAIVTLVISMYALAGQTINEAQQTAIQQVREAHDSVVRLEEAKKHSSVQKICTSSENQSAEECTQYMQSLTDLMNVGLQLQSWSWPLRVAGIWQPTAIKTDQCPTLPLMDVPIGCASRIQNTASALATWIQVILSCITLYILPCLYGYLGSVVATMRHIRRRVDGSTLSFTDRARVSYGQFLGLIVGAVMGLFAAYVLKSDIGQSLGLSAVAFLAGYHVTRLITFLDALSLATFGGPPSRDTG